jgi:hypothetical protein
VTVRLPSGLVISRSSCAEDPQEIALAEVRGYEREVRGRVEEVRSYLSGRAAHEHVGLPDGLSPAEHESLNRLRHNLFIRLDPYLREGSLRPVELEPGDKATDPSEMRRHVQALDSAFTKVRPTSKPLVVYRGFHMPLPRAGEEFTDKSFASTSTDLGHASSFAWDAEGNKRMPLARISIPAGQRVISQANLGIQRYNSQPGAKWDSDAGAGFDPSGEEEILLNRGSRFRVRGRPHTEYSSYDIGQGPVRQKHQVVDLELVP